MSGVVEAIATREPAVVDRSAVIVTRHTSGDLGRVLFLHGLANSSAVWESVVSRISPGVEAWTADLPWCGDGCDEWSHERDPVSYLAQTLDQVCGEIDVVVAHSFSANLLLELLSRRAVAGVDPRHRHGLRGLVLVSPFYRRSPGDFTWTDLTRFPGVFQQIMETGIAVQSGGRIEPEIQRHMALRVCERVGPHGWARFLETYLRTPWLRTDLITLPCLVVAGRRDFSPPLGESAALAADLPFGRLHPVANAGHFSMTEQPTELAALIDRFLASVPPGTD